MKRILLITLVGILSFSYSSAQLADGSIAPDWTLTDVDGTAHNLYSYLDGSYTIFLDFSAVWCGPCWSYHTSGALEDLYIHHGPAGSCQCSGPGGSDRWAIMGGLAGLGDTIYYGVVFRGTERGYVV